MEQYSLSSDAKLPPNMRSVHSFLSHSLKTNNIAMDLESTKGDTFINTKNVFKSIQKTEEYKTTRVDRAKIVDMAKQNCRH